MPHDKDQYETRTEREYREEEEGQEAWAACACSRRHTNGDDRFPPVWQRDEFVDVPHWLPCTQCSDNQLCSKMAFHVPPLSCLSFPVVW